MATSGDHNLAVDMVRWIRNKYRRYDKTRAARRKFAEITSGYPRMFRHWRWVTSAW
jgi:RNA-directed DNA polymerase